MSPDRWILCPRSIHRALFAKPNNSNIYRYVGFRKKRSTQPTNYQRELLINEISKMVVALRNAAHLTQAELANKAGTTQPVIARLESGTDTRIPSLSLLALKIKNFNKFINIFLLTPFSLRATTTCLQIF